MHYIKTLVERFDRNRGHPIRQCIDVLDMLEYAISYPTCATLPESSLREIEERAAEVPSQLRGIDPVLASRVRKWLRNIRHCQELAGRVHRHGHDHIGLLHYHEEVLSIRKAKARLLKALNGERDTPEDHGLLGNKYLHHPPTFIGHPAHA